MTVNYGKFLEIAACSLTVSVVDSAGMWQRPTTLTCMLTSI